MYIAAIVFAGLTLAILAPPANAQQTNRFSEKSRIRIEGPSFRVAAWPYINVADWNKDGITDLIIGQYAGPICVYLRNKDGSFQDMRWVEVNGQEWGGGYTCLSVADWNEDGKLDLVVAQTGVPGVELYLNTGTNGAPEFKDGEASGFGAFKQGTQIMIEDKSPITENNIKGVSAADWNGDGRPDLLLGNSKGEVWLYVNKGGKGRPVLENPVPLNCSGQSTLGDRDGAIPYAADWDRDGRMDLFVVDYPGNLHLYLNKGTGPKATLVPYAGKEVGLLPVNFEGGMSGSLALTDWDGDGKADLLLGCRNAEFYIIRDAAAVEKWRKELLPGRDFNYRRFLTLTFADLNADGKEDIIAGSYNRGLHQYINTGQKGQPAFKGQNIMALYSFSSRAVGIPGPNNYNIRYVQPFPYDWSRDGKMDIIFGDNHGDVILLTNLGTAERPYYDPTRAEGVNRTLLCRMAEGWSVPVVVDWDKNLKPDLVVGAASGKVYLAINRGFPKFPSFTEFTPLKADGKEINVESYASPYLTDWNGDGAPDLLVGDGKGQIHLFLYNTTKSEFRGTGLLTADGNTIKTRARARPWMTDWNGDGIADLVIIGPDDHGYCYISQAEFPGRTLK